MRNINKQNKQRKDKATNYQMIKPPPHPRSLSPNTPNKKLRPILHLFLQKQTHILL